MPESYKIIYGAKETIFTAQIIEKKSRFIASLKKVETEEEATNFITDIKKKYYDARHNCSAFIIGPKKELIRSSDDGEPSGTAGKPMLEVLIGSELVNVVVVVTRYFGGTLLGTGGLVRAYTEAVQEVLKEVTSATMCLGSRLRIQTDYSTIGKLLYELSERNIIIETSDYTDIIVLTIIVKEELVNSIQDMIVQVSGGKNTGTITDKLYFPNVL